MIIRINIGCQLRCLLLVVMVHNLFEDFSEQTRKEWHGERSF